ncbi:hypothetical protein OEA41_001647 [Lepraria neglecta]|uniref:PAC domain-containing protein n=1 Tax=Lepraria neglecta TaxID=209136 RepID=A0AAD9ZB31_9LECA|nr:hypothetical protein OEA41_001647 [Lepraria neglecta]
MPLRQYSSQQGMRQLDGLRQHAPHEANINTGNHGPSSQSNGVYQKIFPPIGVHDFQEFPNRRPNTANATKASSKARYDAPSHMPSFHPPPMQSPEPPSSGQNGAPSATHTRPQGHQASRSASPISRVSSNGTYETQATSFDLPALQAQSALPESDQMEPLTGDLAGSFDLVAPPEGDSHAFSLEHRSEQLFSRGHLEIIFSHPSSLLRFTAFLSTHRPQAVPILIYYLDALKALKAIKYANAIAEALSPIPGHHFTANLAQPTINRELEDKAESAFAVLTREYLPAFITNLYIQFVSLSISQRITGTLAPHLREASEGLAEVFCLSDPSRPDNPIVFASEEFHRTTQYGMSYAIGRNCRFLQGPKTNPRSAQRLGEAIRSGKEHCEVFLNYRRDGSPFMNMLMIAPLCDSRGKIRYFIGAQVDVSGLVKDCTDLETLQRLVVQEQTGQNDADGGNADDQQEVKDDFQDLSEMLNMTELETVRKHGGRMHREYEDEEGDPSRIVAPHMRRLLLQEPTADVNQAFEHGTRQSGRLSGIYQNYLLIRPFPSFRILFASPTLRVPGILQSPFMDKIGGSSRVRDELSTALGEGRGVTAKVRWLSKIDEDGRNRWIHCTPLLGSNGQIGVWMVVLIDDDQELSRRWKQAPPVAPHRGRVYSSARDRQDRIGSSANSIIGRTGSVQGDYPPRSLQNHNSRKGGQNGSLRSASPNSVLI